MNYIEKLIELVGMAVSFAWLTDFADGLAFIRTRWRGRERNP